MRTLPQTSAARAVDK